jgi:hypothetical protein
MLSKCPSHVSTAHRTDCYPIGCLDLQPGTGRVPKVRNSCYGELLALWWFLPGTERARYRVIVGGRRNSLLV